MLGRLARDGIDRRVHKGPSCHVSPLVHRGSQTVRTSQGSQIVISLSHRACNMLHPVASLERVGR